mmetsp:Transcript_13471/g.26665  ORF Transcript_13471/g.26665 Transcript_13471/m.26665 type:complete len:482 (-) Transcript_13471:1403-2848(-)
MPSPPSAGGSTKGAEIIALGGIAAGLLVSYAYLSGGWGRRDGEKESRRNTKAKTYAIGEKEKETRKSTKAKTYAGGEDARALCPFSGNSDFFIDEETDAKPTPLDLLSHWDDTSGFPLAARWLAAGISGQDTPGRLKAGLHRLNDWNHFLLADLNRLVEYLEMKEKALNDPSRHPLCFQAEPVSVEAQRELLDMFLDYLPRRYPDLYAVSGEGDEATVTVIPWGRTFRVSDWLHAPLELCERIVQEDLVLVREVPSDSSLRESNEKSAENALQKVRGDMGNPTERTPHKYGPSGQPYVASAMAVVFSFVDLEEKLGEPLEFLHAPVAGYEQHLRKAINFALTKLTAEKPLWRNNWGIGPPGSLDTPLYGSQLQHVYRTVNGSVSEEQIREMQLKVEYQTFVRLPKTGYVLFTVRSMADPLDSLETCPEAAACLARSIRGMSAGMKYYKGIANEATERAILQFLDKTAKGPARPVKPVVRQA